MGSRQDPEKPEEGNASADAESGDSDAEDGDEDIDPFERHAKSAVGGETYAT